MKRRHPPTRRSAPGVLEWIGDALPAPFTVGDERDAYRPRLALWLERPTDLILAQQILAPDADAGAALAATLGDALASPTAGAPRRPARIRVSDAAMAAAIRPAADGIPVEVGPTPEIDEVIATLAASLPQGESAPESYFEQGRVGAEAVADLFDAAQALHRVKPWKQNLEGHLLRVDIPALGVTGACVCTIGSLGQRTGLLIFPSLDACVAFFEAASRARGKRHARRDVGTTILSLEFERAADLPASMRREAAAHRWFVADAGAYPRVRSHDRDGAVLPLSEREVVVAAACARTLALVFEQHRGLFAAREIEEPISETWSDRETGIDVRVTVPYEAFDCFEDAPGEASAYEPAGPATVESRARGPVGRNDPCPCGSGKKYKKCHLREDEHAREPARERAPAHDLDNRLADAMFDFAMRELGEAWRASGAVFDDVEQSVPLALPWSLYDFRVRGKTAAEWYVEKRGKKLDPAERAWIAAQQRAWLSVWEVQEVEPGVGLTLRDLLTLETRRVNEVLGSRTLVRRDAVLGRIVDAEGGSLICGMHPRALTPPDAAVVLDDVRRRLRRKGIVPVERLRDDAISRHLIERWEDQVAVRERLTPSLPELRNTSGDPFLHTVDHFAIEAGARDEVSSRLAELEGVEAAALGNGTRAYVFLAPRKRGARTARTVLGTARLSERELRLETTSARRADTLRRRIEETCSGLLRHRLREHADPLSERAAGAGDPGPLATPAPPDVQEVLLGWKQRYYDAWLDERIPALDGQTPRQAARTKKGRARLDLLLREMENQEQRMVGAGAYDFAGLRQQLGLE